MATFQNRTSYNKSGGHYCFDLDDITCRANYKSKMRFIINVKRGYCSWFKMKKRSAVLWNQLHSTHSIAERLACCNRRPAHMVGAFVARGQVALKRMQARGPWSSHTGPREKCAASASWRTHDAEDEAWSAD
jgi:hypothetical protein